MGLIDVLICCKEEEKGEGDGASFSRWKLTVQSWPPHSPQVVITVSSNDNNT